MPNSPDPAARPDTNHLPLRMPWGLAIALALYAGAVLLYVDLTWWRSPEYQASEHYEAAQLHLGADRGRTASREELTAAYEELLEAARLMPQVLPLHKELEGLNSLFEERGFRVPQELRRRADAVAILWQRIQEENRPILVVGAKDRGWTPDELMEGPRKAAFWSLPGGVLVVAAWWFTQRGPEAQRREERAREREREIVEAGRYREGLKSISKDAPRPARRSGGSQTRRS